MLKVLCEVEGIAPVTFNKKLMSEKGPNETHNDLEQRVWRERCDCDANGQLVLSGNRFKKAIAMSAAWLNMKIEGEGQAKFNKLFKGCVVVKNSIPLKVNRDDIDYQLIYTKPKKGDGARWIHFPVVTEWNGTLEIHILDEKITEAIFRKVMNYAGIAIGIGSWRPENGGENGRFEILDWVFERI